MTTTCYAALIDGPGQDTRVDAVYEDQTAAQSWVDSIGPHDGVAYLQEVDYVPTEPTTTTDAELLATMLAIGDGPLDLDIDGPQLDMLAYDIADTMDRGEYGLGDITQDDIRAVLPAFLIACLANADANEIVTCDRCGEPGRSLCEDCVNRRNES